MKNLCVLGCLLTEAGKAIKTEMLSWLEQEYDVLCIDQKPPGSMFEYLAIKYAIKMTIDMNEPVLYIHTKGAAHDYIWERSKKNYQSEIRKFWAKQFIENKSAYFNADLDSVLVNTPMLSNERKTIFNAFVIYPNAAKELLKTFHKDNDRFYYESMFSKISTIKLQGIVKHLVSEHEIKEYITTGKF